MYSSRSKSSPKAKKSPFKGKSTTESLKAAEKPTGVPPPLPARTPNLALHAACQRGDAATLYSLLRSALQIVDEQDNHRMTPLHWASTLGNRQMVEMLLGRRASPLMRDSLGRTPLHIACERGHVDIIQLLSTAIGVVDEEGWTALHAATAARREEIVRVLLALGADPEKGKPSPVHLAAFLGDTDLLSLLLRPSLLERKDQWGRIPLHIAAAEGHEDAIQLLLQSGSNALLRDLDDRTPLTSLIDNSPFSDKHFMAFLLMVNAVAETSYSDADRELMFKLASDHRMRSLTAILRELFQPPADSLKALCRQTVRRQLHSLIFMRAHWLRLSPKLTNYLTFLSMSPALLLQLSEDLQTQNKSGNAVW